MDPSRFFQHLYMCFIDMKVSLFQKFQLQTVDDVYKPVPIDNHNLESIQGALLRMNRSIQAEGTFGIMKNDRWYKRIVRRGIKSVLLEVFLVSIGHNLYKYHNKQKKGATAA